MIEFEMLENFHSLVRYIFFYTFNMYRWILNFDHLQNVLTGSHW